MNLSSCDGFNHIITIEKYNDLQLMIGIARIKHFKLFYVLYIFMSYRMAQNFGGVKLCRIDRFRALVRKMLANLQ